MNYLTQEEYNNKRRQSKELFEKKYYRRKLRDFFIMHIYGKKVSKEYLREKYIDTFGVNDSASREIVNLLYSAELIKPSSKNWHEHETDNIIYEFNSRNDGLDIFFPKVLMFAEHCLDHDSYEISHFSNDSFLITKKIKTHKKAVFSKSHGENFLTIGFRKGDLAGVMPYDFDNIDFQIKDDKFYLTFIFESSLIPKLENLTTVKSSYSDSKLSKINSKSILLDSIEYDISLMEDDYFRRLQNALHDFKKTNLFKTLEEQFNLYL